jgi:hypothetical protein
LSFLVPRHPGPGQETVFSQAGATTVIQPAQ